ncbi:MAG: epoxyqueuosine reductase QueH [Actinobacteria bacterium]|nr:epoxyqueuosine reductase QueH [Actinomycetota bacterium]
MNDLLMHVCCGPCSTVAVPAWRDRGVEPVAWFHNPNIQPVPELERRLESMRRYSRAAGLELVIDGQPSEAAAWREWIATLSEATPDERCAACLGLRLRAAAAAAARLGVPRFSTTLSVSPYQRHDLIQAAGQTAAAEHGVTFAYLDLRGSFRESYAESRRLDLYRQAYCGCAASKWQTWHERALRKKAK